MKITLLSLWKGELKMTNLIRSDFYKLFRTKAFYFCGIIAALLSSLGVVLLNSAINSELGISASLLGYDGVYALITGTGQATLFVTIMISMFVPNEFSFGTIKNIVSKGVSRLNIYLSKVVMSVFISVAYVLFCAIVSFAIGSFMWGTGELTREVYLNIFKMLGLFLVAEIAVQSIFVMVGFIIRQTGGTVAVNLAIIIAVPVVIIPALNFGVQSLLKVEDFDSSNYWPFTYLSRYLSLDVIQEDITVGLIVCVVCVILSTALGVFSLYKRDVK